MISEMTYNSEHTTTVLCTFAQIGQSQTSYICKSLGEMVIKHEVKLRQTDIVIIASVYN